MERPKKRPIIQSARKDLQSEPKEPTSWPFGDLEGEKKPKPIWLKALMNPFLWPLPAIFLNILLFAFGKGLWNKVATGRHGSVTPASQMSSSLLTMLFIYYLPWKKIFELYGLFFGGVPTMRGQLRTNEQDAGCAKWFLRVTFLAAIYWHTYVWWQSYM